MQKLTAELTRLYLPAGASATTPPLNLASADGRTRALVIGFDRQPGADEMQHWSALCLVANALQTQLDLPAPAVSISGSHGYRLWLSFDAAMPVAVATKFLGLLRLAYFPEMPEQADVFAATVEFPPSMNAGTGLWAAFINPGLGASFADESGLEMAPPAAGQLALLDGLNSISEPQFARAMSLLELAHGPAPAAAATPAPGGLLLKDATLEDIVKHLHSLHIEPTFRHLIK